MGDQPCEHGKVPSVSETIFASIIRECRFSETSESISRSRRKDIVTFRRLQSRNKIPMFRNMEHETETTRRRTLLGKPLVAFINLRGSEELATEHATSKENPLTQKTRRVYSAAYRNRWRHDLARPVIVVVRTGSNAVERVDKKLPPPSMLSLLTSTHAVTHRFYRF